MKRLVAVLILCASMAGAGIVEDAGVSGGLAVVIGCEDMALLQELRQAGFVVQALERDPSKVATAREVLQNSGHYGKISVVQLVGGRLPYTDNLVNLVVVRGPGCEMPDREIERVLAPRGVAVGAEASRITKAVPPRIDDWPMHMYAPNNNAVSNDRIVGPPKHLQWRSGPDWTRSHEYASSLNAMVSMGGKLYYTMDEGSRLSPVYPAKWRLVCQDAFNGVILWKRDLPSWHTHWWPVKSGPTQAMRRLVAIDDKVYVPLGIGEPVSELDAKTGETIRSFETPDAVEEIRISEGELFVLTGDAVFEQQKYNMDNVEVWGAAGDATGTYKWDDRRRTLTAFDLKSGESIWQVKQPVMTITTAIDDRRVYFHNGTGIVALDRKTGDKLWESESLELKQYKLGTATAPSLVVYEDTVLCGNGFDFKEGVLLSLDSETGETLWRKVHQSSGHSSPDDIHVIDGLAWEAGIARISKQGGTYKGYNPRTGKIEKEFPLDVEHKSWFHQRCYRSRATENYLMPAATGIEYVAIANDDQRWTTHHWVRGACLYGVLPANGMTYATPHPCACFMESMVRGFSALAPAGGAGRQGQEKADGNHGRLVKGPAYLEVPDSGFEIRDSDWPTYRRGAGRAGYAKTDISSQVKETWATEIGGKITPPVSAAGMVYVAAVDRHSIHALDADTGKQKWAFTADSRIDSPPSLYRGSVIFGCADGNVYCVSAGSGELAWKLRAAPEMKMICNDGNIESAWPAHGSVLIVQDKVYALAGRSLFLDGGMWLNVINPKTGELIACENHSDIDPETGKSMQLSNTGLKMVPSNSDILSFDGTHIYMKAQKIGLDGKRVFADANKGRREYSLSNSAQDGEGSHLFSPPGFLDTVWHHRSYWLYGRSAGSGWGGWMKPGKFVPAGRILVVDEDKNVFGYGREPAFFAQAHVMEYQLFSAKGGVYKRDDWRKAFAGIKNKETSITNWKQNREQPLERNNVVQYNWREVGPTIIARAMVGANDKLVIAGPPDILDEARFHGRFQLPEVDTQVRKQEAAVNGEKGGVMRTMSASDGKKLAETRLTSLPVFDGLIAANGKLLMSTMDGQVICYE
jgi:outer membrane protein assembly factor BamB